MRQRNMARRDRNRKGTSTSAKKSRQKRDVAASKRDSKRSDKAKTEPPKGKGAEDTEAVKQSPVKKKKEDKHQNLEAQERELSKDSKQKGSKTPPSKDEEDEELLEDEPIRKVQAKSKKKTKKGQLEEKEKPNQEKGKGAKAKSTGKQQKSKGLEEDSAPDPTPAKDSNSSAAKNNKGKNNKRKAASGGGGGPGGSSLTADSKHSKQHQESGGSSALPLRASDLKPDNHPFPIGAVITAFHSIDGQEHFCDIIERAKVPSNAAKDKKGKDSKDTDSQGKKQTAEEKEKGKVTDKKEDSSRNDSKKQTEELDQNEKRGSEMDETKGEDEDTKEGKKTMDGQEAEEESTRDSEDKTVQQVKEEILASQEQQKKPGGSIKKSMVETNTVWRYYVHFHEFNRRMDAWLEPDQVLRAPNQAAAYLRELEREVLAAMGSFSEEDRGMKTRNQKRKTADDEIEEIASAHSMSHHGEEHHGMDEAALKEHEEVTKVKNVNTVYLGNTQMETWYFSPFPAEFVPPNEAPIEALYFCQFTLRFFRHESELHRWQRRKNLMRHPPGNEIYRHKHIAMFEVDGAHEKIYSENLSYLAKLFLDHKTLYYDTDCFLFYVMCEIDEWGYHPVGYFSKEKYSENGYNLACILTFPAYQKKGYGRFLIEFSYELSIIEEKVGSPEKPLSDLGLVSYRSFWASKLLRILNNYKDETISIMQLSKITSIMSDDVVYTLQFLGILKYVGGAHIITATPELLEEASQKYPAKEPKVDVEKIHWTTPITPELIKLGRDKFSIHSKKPKEDIEH